MPRPKFAPSCTPGNGNISANEGSRVPYRGQHGQRLVLVSLALVSIGFVAACGSNTQPVVTTSAKPPAGNSATSAPPVASPGSSQATSLAASATAQATQGVSWTPPAGTIPGNCGGNGLDGRESINGWEVCWSEETISRAFARNMLDAAAANNFADGRYTVNSPTSGNKQIDCQWFIAHSQGQSIFGCRGGTVTGNGAIEISWLG